MAQVRYVSYLRVSTARQGQSGLGIEAQRAAVSAYLQGCDGSLIGEFVEVESGARSDRPELAAAFAACRIHGARLVIAKLDRLARDAHFLLGLDKAGIDFVATDMPHANRLTVGIMALVAEQERAMISARTKAALAAAKARGVKLGKPENLSGRDRGCEISAMVRRAKAEARAADLLPIITSLQEAGASTYAALAQALNERGIPTARGGQWRPAQVQRVMDMVSGEYR